LIWGKDQGKLLLNIPIALGKVTAQEGYRRVVIRDTAKPLPSPALENIKPEKQAFWQQTTAAGKGHWLTPLIGAKPRFNDYLNYFGHLSFF
jgi:hypothetical protein